MNSSISSITGISGLNGSSTGIIKNQNQKDNSVSMSNISLNKSSIFKEKPIDFHQFKRNIDDKDGIISRLLFDGGYYQRSLNILE